MSIQTVPSLEVFLTKGTWIARGFNMSFNMFLHVLLGVVTVAADVTDKCTLRYPPNQSLDFLINVSMVCTPSCKAIPWRHLLWSIHCIQKKLSAGFRSCISGEMHFYAHYSYDFSCSLLFWEPSHRLHNVGPDVWCGMLRRASTCLPLAWTPCHSQGTATLTAQRRPSLWSCVARSRHQDSQALQADVKTKA